MNVRQLANLIAEHTAYCVDQYQPYKLPHLTSEKALNFQNEMCQSLTHFGMWLETVKFKDTSESELCPDACWHMHKEEGK